LLSGSKNEGEKRDKINVTILATLVLSVVFSAVIFAGSPLIVNVLFSGLKVEEKEIGIKLIKDIHIHYLRQ
jgi:peptidoglycan biosynthesis protein MviN/MurJ (putative lipid II flippase)